MTTEPTSPATELCGDQLFGWTCTLPAGPHPDCKHRGNGHWWDQTRPVPEAPAPLSPQREQEIRETHPGEWYDGPWTQDYVDSNGDEPAYCRVVHHESGTTLATLPDFAGSIALFIADAHDAVPELLATLDAERAKVAALEKRVAELDSSDTTTQYGIRTPDGDVLNSTEDHRESVARLGRYQDTWPDAVLVKRTVRHSEWTDVANTGQGLVR